MVIWINGLAGSGKSTISNALAEAIRRRTKGVVHLDGDAFREIFQLEDQEESYSKLARINIAFKRAKLAEALSQQGLIVINSAISLFKEVYKFNRNNITDYLEIFIHCDMQELRRRDQKKLYSNYSKGLERNIVGLDIPFDLPSPDITIDNNNKDSLEDKINQILNHPKMLNKILNKISNIQH